MAGNFDLPSWLTTQTPWSGSDAFLKGSQVGSAIAANRIRAKQLYADVQQTQQRLDLAEREQLTQDEASNLRNQVLRTKLANDAADFEVLRQWWPQFQSSEGEIDMPVLRDENTMLKVAAAVAEKRSKIGQAAFAELMATPGFDLANAEHQKQYFELLSRYKNIPAKLGPDGVMGPIKVAESLKRLRDEANSRITARGERTKLDALVEGRRKLIAESTIDLNDARIAKYDKDIAFEERRLALGEKNATLRGQEQGLREKRFDANWAPEDRAEFNQRTKVINDSNATAEEKDLAIQEIREDITAKREQRLPKPEKAAPPVPLPANPSAENLKKGTIYDTKKGPGMWDGEKFIEQ